MIVQNNRKESISITSTRDEDDGTLDFIEEIKPGKRIDIPFEDGDYLVIS